LATIHGLHRTRLSIGVDHRPTRDLPRDHPTVDIDDFVTETDEELRRDPRTTAVATHDVHVGVDVDLVEAGRDIDQTDVNRTGCMAERPLVVFANIEEYAAFTERRRDGVDRN
jgi:hypothetical protein